MGATLANGGVNPITGKKALKAKYVPNVLSVMATCGMYDYSGEWIYHVGLPAKSGVGGAVMAVLPGQLSIAVYSPLLDKKGNSALGIDICKKVAERFSLHLYKTPKQIKQVLRREMTLRTARSKYKRDELAENIFGNFGDKVLIMELHGVLCFATCEYFMRKIPAYCEALILNVKRFTTMDDGALNLLLKLYEEFQTYGKTIFITDFHQLDLFTSRTNNYDFLKFPHFDDAMFCLENIILTNHGYVPKVEPVQLRDQQLLKGLTDEELEKLRRYLQYKRFKEGEIIIEKGSAAENRCFLEAGRVAIQDTSVD
jgi:glutaminase